MPCRCDYEEPPGYAARNLKDEHTRACQAQSLAHKIAMFAEKQGLVLPPDLSKRVKEVRKELLAHKKTEHQEDIDKLARAIDKTERNIKAIYGLGGEPKPAILKELEGLKASKVKLHQVSDAELLGDEHY